MVSLVAVSCTNPLEVELLGPYALGMYEGRTLPTALDQVRTLTAGGLLLEKDGSCLRWRSIERSSDPSDPVSDVVEVREEYRCRWEGSGADVVFTWSPSSEFDRLGSKVDTARWSGERLDLTIDREWLRCIYPNCNAPWVESYVRASAP